jgi:hypothetical protein
MVNYYFKSFIFIQDISCLISIIFGIKLLRHFNISLKLIFSLLCLGLMTNVVLLICYGIFKKQNLFIINIYSILELVLLSFFYITITQQLFFKRLVLFLLVIYVLVALFDFYINSVFSISHYKISSFANFLISFYAICFFIFSMNHHSEKISTKFSLFWINSGILIYYMPFIIIYLFTEYLNKISNLFLSALTINFNNILTVIFMTFIIIGFLKSKNKNYEIKTN